MSPAALQLAVLRRDEARLAACHARYASMGLPASAERCHERLYEVRLAMRGWASRIIGKGL